jgi:hypothetical protein
MALLVAARRGIAAATAGVWLSAAPVVMAQPQGGSTESSVRAVFLFNFPKYVTWPPTEAGERSPADIRICVTADDEFFTLLKAAVHGEDIDGKPLVPVALDGLDAAAGCHILYVGAAGSADGKAWLNAVRRRQVLTVGEGPLTDELVIAFVRDNNRIRFDINRSAAKARGLIISSKLLRLAREVRDR